jgi:hypothetical protein
MFWLWRHRPPVSDISQETEQRIDAKRKTITFAKIIATTERPLPQQYENGTNEPRKHIKEEHISHAPSRKDASQQEEDYDMVGTRTTLPTAEPDNPHANVDAQLEEIVTNLQHNPMDQETTALVDDMTYKATNMKEKETNEVRKRPLITVITNNSQRTQARATIWETRT